MNTNQPKKANVWQKTAVMVSAMIGFCLLAAGTAHASGSTLAGHWLLTLTFPNDQPTVELTTQIWAVPSSGSPYLVTSQTEALDCTVNGTLQVTNETAVFTGQEFISCTLPNMADKFEEVSSGALTTPTTVLARKPFVEGQMVVGGSGTAVQPVFYHPSMQYGLARTSATQAEQLLRVDGAETRSSAFVQSAPYDLRAELKIRPNGTYRTLFTANGVTNPGVPANLGSGLFINLEETTIYFGYSPASNAFFEGSVKSLTADPGVFGRD